MSRTILTTLARSLSRRWSPGIVATHVYWYLAVTPRAAKVLEARRRGYVMPVYRSRVGRLRKDFLQALARDLRAIGHLARVRTCPQHITLSFTGQPFEDRTAQQIRALYLALRNRSLREEAAFIHKLEAGGILEEFIEPSQLNPKQISPDVVVCETRRQSAIFRYTRQMQSIPTSRGVGRQMAALVYDRGQERPALMGVIGLASPTYAQKCRDDELGWTAIEQPSKSRKVRRRGLERMMQLSVCEAVPPYNYLDGGKLMALLAFSDPMRDAYKAAHRTSLLAMSTTVATGRHSALFNRIQLTKVPREAGEPALSRTELFKHIGDTEGYTTSFVQPETIELARALVRHSGTRRRRNGDGIRTTWSRDRVVKDALRLCGVSRTVLQSNRKAIYIGALDDSHLLALGRPTLAPKDIALTVDQAARYWMENVAAKAIATGRYEAKVVQHSQARLRLSSNL